jgi:hypothetical protein
MATAIPKLSSSFIYEDLVSHIQTIGNQMLEIENILSNRWKNEKRKRDELKSRSLIFIDPYGNRKVSEHMDHELINNIIRKYKKDYVPKYLQEWIQIGTMKENIILPLNDFELKSNVSYYVNGYQFTTYGEAIISISMDEIFQYEVFALSVLLTDNMENIKIKIKDRLQITDMELKLWMININTKVNENIWNEGTMLKSEDTILSCQLYQDDCVIIVKIIPEKVISKMFFFSSSVI